MRIVFDSEKELEDWIFNKYQEDGIVCIDGTEPDHLIRQMNLGVYGICDLVSFSVYKNDRLTSVDVCIYELKKEKITAEAFSQVSRYATAITQSIEAHAPDVHVNMSCALVGTEIDESCYILNHSEFLYYKPFFNPDCGVDFQDVGSGWHRKNDPIAALVDILDGSLREKETKEHRGFE